MSKKGWTIVGVAGGLTALAAVAVVLITKGGAVCRLFRR